MNVCARASACSRAGGWHRRPTCFHAFRCLYEFRCYFPDQNGCRQHADAVTLRSRSQTTCWYLLTSAATNRSRQMFFSQWLVTVNKLFVAWLPNGQNRKRQDGNEMAKKKEGQGNNSKNNRRRHFPKNQNSLSPVSSQHQHCRCWKERLMRDKNEISLDRRTTTVRKYIRIA